MGATGLTEVSLSSYLREISVSSFQSCTNLETINLEYGLKNIYSQAFYGCTSLGNIIFPNSLIDVHTELFGMLGNNNCKLIFLGLNTVWRSNKSAWPHNYIVYCKIGSQMLQSSRQLGCKVHPLSEYYENR